MLRRYQSNMTHILPNNLKIKSSRDIVFKSCSRNWIVVLQKLDDTICNEHRTNVVNPLFAKYRANKLKVLDIFNKFTHKTTDTVTNSIHTATTIEYSVGKNVCADKYDLNENNICTTGIHYFKHPEVAYYTELNVDEEFCELCVKDEHKTWYDNGATHSVYKYIGRKLFSHNCWWSNGNKYLESYVRQDGIVVIKEWDKNGICVFSRECDVNDVHKN